MIDPEAAALWESAERGRAAILTAVRSHRETSGKGFGPVQLLHHLVLAEAELLGHMRASPPGQRKRRPTRNPLYRVLVGMMRAGRTLPAPPSMIPRETANPEELENRWQELRDELRSRVESVAPGEVVGKHPLLGWLSAPQLIDIIDSHMAYHVQRDLPRFGARA